MERRRAAARALLAVACSLALHALAVGSALLGTTPKLPFVDFEVAEVDVHDDEGTLPLPPPPADERAAAADEPQAKNAAKVAPGLPLTAAPRPDDAAPATAAEPPAADEPAPATASADGEPPAEDNAVVIPETGPAESMPESAPLKEAQGPSRGPGPPREASSAPRTEDPMLAWKALHAAGSPLGDHVPGDSRLAVWVDMAALRRSPLRADVGDTLHVLAGLDELIGWTGVDLVEDVDELVIASPNPYVPGLLYLVVRLRAPAKGSPAAASHVAPAEGRLAGLGEKARRLEVAPGVFAFARAAAAKPPYVVTAVADDVLAVFPARRAAKLLAPDAGPASRPSVTAAGKATALLAGAAPGPGEGPLRRADGPELLLAGTGVERLLPMIDWGAFAPAPESLRVAIDVVVGAEVHAEMRFKSGADAARAREAWAKVLDDLRDTWLLTLIGVRPLLDSIDVFVDGDALRGTLELKPDDAVRVLRAIRPLLVGPPP